MIEFNKKTNTLEQVQYKYTLQDVSEPNLYRDIFSYDEIPKCTFNHRKVPMAPPDEIWITDTTFRDGQQSRAPYTVEQIVHLYDLLHKLADLKVLSDSVSFSFTVTGTNRLSTNVWREDTNILRLQAG